ncbi:hypothetical protein LQG66_13180 [Bradyrhizobium ontarionense]|uniref:Lipoprotein n=1 Tax=Bradyrhizobium ontarionense TaxID=2898149 RepID=A0ABY3RK51_9BRAD|nr:hypothetical protein [Bradyrhizobium sp. A19]UFZ07192.1 hypothetical protein LQG66_13180 [Bradyrhizobium sp. A19]
MRRMRAALFGGIVAVSLVGCQTTEQAEFLSHGPSDRAELLASYSRERKWRMFKYANQVVHPPMIGLASVLARDGEPMLRLILASLDTTDNDLDYRDALQVFAEMERAGTYRICADRPVLAKIEDYRDRIRDAGWRAFYGDRLRDLCRAKRSR